MSAEQPARPGRWLEGLPASAGLAVAPGWWLTGTSAAPTGGALGSPAEANETTKDAREDPDPEVEECRLTAALEAAGAELESLAERMSARVGEQDAAIFRAQAAFTADPEVVEPARDALREGLPAEEAVRRAFDTVREVLAEAGSAYLAARASDLDDVRDRVLRLLAGAPEQAVGPEEPVVLLADALTPSQTARLDASRVQAIVTRTGSPTSHAAILARALGIPAVVGVEGLDTVGEGVMVGVDGDEGAVLVAPDEHQRARLQERAAARVQRRAQREALRHQPGATADGVRIELAANLGGPGEVSAAVEAGAEGVGLLRTELLYLDRVEPPTVTEQQATYRAVLEGFAGARVVVRTLDAGADKPLPFAVHGQEPNPALGLRGVRLSLRTPEVLAEQVRALLRAHREVPSAALAVMLPMVSVPSEVDEARAVAQRVAEEEGVGLAGLELGAMVEVPAAALRAGALARRCHFLSIGTNDLLQYLFAADRLVGDVASLADLMDPAALALVGQVITAAHREGAWVGVCGEAAADPLAAAALCGLGVDELSMSAGSIPEIKELLARHEHRTLAEAATDALRAEDAEQARQALQAALEA